MTGTVRQQEANETWRQAHSELPREDVLTSPSDVNRRAGLAIQEIVKAMVQMLEERQKLTRDVTMATQISEEQGERPLDGSTASNAGSQNWHQIKFATKLISVFKGKEEENVTKWLKRILSVARLLMTKF